MDKNKLHKIVKKMAEGYYMPAYKPKVKNLYDNTPYEERKVIMTTIFYPENYAVYNYGELPTDIQTAINDYFNNTKTMKLPDTQAVNEMDDETTGGQGIRLTNNIIVKFKNEDEAIIAADGLKDVNNYGKYINQFQTLDPGLKKYLSDTFGPSIPSQKKAALKKRREELGDETFDFKIKTGQAIIDAIKSYFEEKPSKSIITFKVDKDQIIVPTEQNILTKQNLKDILKTVFTTVGLKGFEISEKEGLDEAQLGVEFGPGFADLKGSGERKIPKVIAFPYWELKEKFPNDFKLASKTNSKGKPEYSLYISKNLKTSLDQIQRGRTSRDTEKRKFELTKQIEDALQPMVRGILKKATDGIKLVNVGGQEMYPVKWPILGKNKEGNVLWLASQSTEKFIDTSVYESKMTPAQKKKRGKFFDELTAQGMPNEKAGKIATSQAMKEDIDVGHQDNEPHMLKASLYNIAKYAMGLYKMLDKYEKMNTEVDFPDWWQEKIHLAADYMDTAKNYLEFEEKEPKLDVAVNTMENYSYPKGENPFLNYITQEQNLIAKRFKVDPKLTKFDYDNNAVVFPDPIKIQIINGDDVMLKTVKMGNRLGFVKGYYDENGNEIPGASIKLPTTESTKVDEDIEPTTMDMNQEDMLDTLIRKYMDQYVDTKTDDFVDRYGDNAEKVMYGAAVKRAEQDMEERGLPVKEKMDPVGKEDDDINNDGKVDKTDKYLLNKRNAIAASIAKKLKKQ